jgi:hypothetical protein
MKAYFFCLLLICFLSGCGKSGGGGNTPAQEAALVFTTNPDPGTSIYAALSSSQDIVVNITSTIPAAGVTADITVTKDLDNTTVFSQSLTNTLASFTVNINNLSSGAVCTVVITLTSKSSATNKASKSFKIAKK